MKRIFYSKEHQEYYTDDKIPCSFCKKIHSFLFLVTFSKPNFHTEWFYCDNCVKNIPEQPHLIKTTKMIVYTNILPKDCIPVIDSRVDTGYGKMGLTVWDVANKQIDNEHITDKTVYSGRESFEGATIGYVDKDLLDFKESEITIEKALRLMKNAE
jgi:hypothetical protein